MPSPNDNTLLTANNLGVLSSAREINDSFDATDRIAYYKFTLAQNSDLSIAFSGRSLRATLIADINNNGIFDSNEDLISRFGASESLFKPLPAGTYFIELKTSFTQPNPYNLRLAPTPKPSNVSPDPGNSIAQAFNLGTLSGQRIVRDYVGDLDELDFYRFTVSRNSSLGVVVARETRVIPISIIADKNANGVVDRGEVIRVRPSTSTSFSANLSAGTYFIALGRTYSTPNSHYELTLTRSNGSSRDDGLVETAAKDTILGLDDGDILSGDANDNFLKSGTGNDTITGGDGRDRIVLSRGRGFDRVTDFQNNLDKIDLVGINFSELTLQQQQNDVLVKLGQSNVLLIENTSIRDISSGDFV